MSDVKQIHDEIERLARAAAFREVREAVTDLDAFDLEWRGPPYLESEEMVKQEGLNVGYAGWVKRDDVLALFAPGGRFGEEKP